MTPPGCSEVSAAWHRCLIVRSKTTLGIPSRELWLRNGPPQVTVWR